MVQKTIVIQTAFVGDLLLTIPLLKRLRILYPEGQIDLVCRKGLGKLLQTYGLVDRIHEIDKSSKKNKKSSIVEIKKNIQNQKFDLLISPHQSFASGLLSKKIKSREKIGYQNWWNGFIFNRRYKRPMHLPEVLRQMALLVDIDQDVQVGMHAYLNNDSNSKISEISKMSEDLLIPEWASMLLRSSLEDKIERENIVFLAPGSVWATKRWTVEGYIKLGKNLLSKGFSIYLIGAPDEQKLCENIFTELGEKDYDSKKIVNLCGQTTLEETCQWLSKGKALVSNDSGAMHLASVVGLPVVSVFGPTTLDLGYRPWQDKAIVVEHVLSCRPCGKHGSNKCPIGTHECMTAVKAEDVESALLKVVF